MMAARELNPHELIARALKVSLIVALVPEGATRAENLCYAAELASWGQERRDRFAAAAGAKHPPSEETWRAVVEVVRDRIPGGDAKDRAMPILTVLKGGRS